MASMVFFLSRLEAKKALSRSVDRPRGGQPELAPLRERLLLKSYRRSSSRKR